LHFQIQTCAGYAAEEGEEVRAERRRRWRAALSRRILRLLPLVDEANGMCHEMAIKVTFAPRLAAAAAAATAGSTNPPDASPLLEVVVHRNAATAATAAAAAPALSAAPLNAPGQVSGYAAPASTPGGFGAAAGSRAADLTATADDALAVAWGEEEFADRCFMLRDVYGAWQRGGRDVGALAVVVAAAAQGETGEDPLHYNEDGGEDDAGDSGTEGYDNTDDTDDDDDDVRNRHRNRGGGKPRYIGAASLAMRPLLYGLPTTGRLAVTGADGAANGHIMASLVPCTSTGDEDGVREVDDPTEELLVGGLYKLNVVDP
jgi:hypothetical protein